MKKKNKAGTVDYKAMVRAIYDLLHLDMDGKGNFYNADKTWDVGDIEMVNEIVSGAFKVKPVEGGRDGEIEAEQLPADQPQIDVVAYVSGGVLQGARATVPKVGFEVFDADNKHEDMSSDEIEAEWDETAKQFPYPIF